MHKEMLLVGLSLALLHEGGVLNEAEAVGGDAAADPVRREGGGWRGGGHHRHRRRFGVRRHGGWQVGEPLVKERFHAENKRK